MASLLMKKSYILICIFVWMDMGTTDGRSPMLDEEGYFEDPYSPPLFNPTGSTPKIGHPATTKSPEGLTTKTPTLKPIGVTVKGHTTLSAGLGAGTTRNNSKPTKATGVGTVGGRFEPTNGTRLETVRGRIQPPPRNGSGVGTVGGHFEPTNAEDLETVRGHFASPKVSYQVDRRRRFVPETESSFSTTFGLRNKTTSSPSSIPSSGIGNSSSFGSPSDGKIDLRSGDEVDLNNSFPSSRREDKSFDFPTSANDNQPLDPKVPEEQEGSGSSQFGNAAPPSGRSIPSSSRAEDPKLVFPTSGGADDKSINFDTSSSSSSSSFGITGETVSTSFSTSSKSDDIPPDSGAVDDASLQGRSYNSFETPLRNIKCVGVGEFYNQPSKDKWCLNNCLHFPSYCPSQYCKCDYVD